MATCYRHPGRETNVSCSNCGRPICPDCMTSTSVGMRCPECAGERTRVRNPVGAPTRSDAPVTYSVIALCVAAFVGELAGGGTSAVEGGGTLIRDGGLVGFGLSVDGPIGVAEGEWYRLLAGAFGALLLDPNEVTVGASGGVFGMMAAAFLIARNRGMDQLASQIGFFVVINLVFTFSIPNISVGGHIGGLVGGGLAALIFSALERRRLPNAAAPGA